MKIKTSEAKDKVLDYLVARCEGREVSVIGDSVLLWVGKDSNIDYEPSIAWAQGGPIIERERISVWFERHDDVDSGLPIWFAQDGYAPAMQGPTPLIAAMRCYVAGMLGDEVDVPNELTEAL
jgi:hypothetical protein